MSLSPMMQQYHQAKQAAGDALLLFRMGDFYELFYDDAKTAARVLGLSLTSRDKGENPVAMAGFPHHQLDQYLAKIIAAGYRAAVCEQLEDPAAAKGIVKRDITRIVSRGTLTDDTLLDPLAGNYLAAVVASGDAAGIAWVDISTGRFWATAVDKARVADELARISPAELLVSEAAVSELPTLWTEGRAVTTRPPWVFSVEQASETLTRHFGTQSLEGFGFDCDRYPAERLALAAAAATLQYLEETQKTQLAHIERLACLRAGGSLEIDAATWRSLEVTQTMRDGRREGSLLGVLDRTTTAMGARQLAEWLARPLVDVAEIDARLDAVGELVEETALAGAIRDTLKNIYDLERLVARVTTHRASPRDLSCVAKTLAAMPALKAKLTGRNSKLLADLDGRIDLCPDLRSTLEKMLADDCPLTTRDGGFIRPGAHPRLDECRELMAGGKRWMAEYQATEVTRTGIGSIKVGFNKVFGYYLEITHIHRDKVPPEYIRKQTLKNAERYITPELKEYEEKVLTAEDRALSLELELFVELRQQTAQAGPRLLATAAALAQLDVLASLAEVARSRGYVRPEVVDQPRLDVEGGRHPVVEAMEPGGTFVPNDVTCAARAPEANGDADSPASVLLITGPNMAGKSTYIRQTVLLVLLAQIGSFVPARRATIGVADRLFARVGASDELSRGQSTFMVEMTEAARILNTATRRSLVVLDEIGRGTSTYDGLSLAWSMVEYIHDHIGCRTLFATHYHELTALADQLAGVTNLNVMVREHFGKIVFLHQIVPGAADRSYGIHVAQLAGVPREVSSRAEEILATLEEPRDNGQPGTEAAHKLPTSRKRKGKKGDFQLTLFEMVDHPLLDEIRGLDVNGLTPLAALEKLSEWSARLKEQAH